MLLLRGREGTKVQHLIILGLGLGLIDVRTNIYTHRHIDICAQQVALKTPRIVPQSRLAWKCSGVITMALHLARCDDEGQGRCSMWYTGMCTCVCVYE